MKSIYKLLKHKTLSLIEQFLPAQCLICQLASQHQVICQHCLHTLLAPRPCCRYCGLSLPTSADFCGDCIKQQHTFTYLHALSGYQPPYPKLIKQLKYGKKLIIAELLGQLLSLSIKQQLSKQHIQSIDYLLAVPLHKKKLRHRGFNQTLLLTEVIAKQLSIPIIKKTIQRQKETHPQEGLSLNKRKKNLRNAFKLNNPAQLQGKHIAVIDDVVTTGATINSLCQCLLEANVTSITVFCISRTNHI